MKEKSCNLETFTKWVRLKFNKEKEVTKLYAKPKFRNDRFTKYCLKMRSEDKMLNDLNKFIKERKNTSRTFETSSIKIISFFIDEIW
jgi:hypothetical protein